MAAFFQDPEEKEDEDAENVPPAAEPDADDESEPVGEPVAA